MQTCELPTDDMWYWLTYYNIQSKILLPIVKKGNLKELVYAAQFKYDSKLFWNSNAKKYKVLYVLNLYLGC